MNDQYEETYTQTSDGRITAEELQERYEEQQRRLSCPGCGEEPFIG